METNKKALGRLDLLKKHVVAKFTKGMDSQT